VRPNSSHRAGFDQARHNRGHRYGSRDAGNAYCDGRASLDHCAHATGKNAARSVDIHVWAKQLSWGPWTTIAAITIFAGTYLFIAIGKLPGYQLDRAGAALLGASLMVGLGVVSLDQAYRAIDFDAITLLLGMMILVANLRLSGFFRLVSNHRRRCATEAFGAVMSAQLRMSLTNPWLAEAPDVQGVHRHVHQAAVVDGERGKEVRRNNEPIDQPGAYLGTVTNSG
jgi:hypothetical protein